jgi:hypothetical protein
MRFRTAVALYWFIFNSMFLCWYFTMLFIHGAILITEHSRLIAGFEIVLLLGMIILGIERLIHLREQIT